MDHSIYQPHINRILPQFQRAKVKDNKIRCPVCNKGYCRGDYLKTHLKLTHSNFLTFRANEENIAGLFRLDHACDFTYIDVMHKDFDIEQLFAQVQRFKDNAKGQYNITSSAAPVAPPPAAPVAPPPAAPVAPPPAAPPVPAEQVASLATTPPTSPIEPVAPVSPVVTANPVADDHLENNETLDNELDSQAEQELIGESDRATGKNSRVLYQKQILCSTCVQLKVHLDAV